MAEQTEVEWPTCTQAGCIGIRLAAGRRCLAHASEEETAAALTLVGETGEINARGVPITPALLERILTAAPRGENEEPLITGCQFQQATFTGDAGFGETTFTGPAQFSGATFTGQAWFHEATFSGGAIFAEATFSGETVFGETTFNNSAFFNRATFNGDTWIGQATFNLGAWFNQATFNNSVSFRATTFNDGAAFLAAIFTGDAEFDGATFNGSAAFDGATFKHGASFQGVRFEQWRQFGPVLAYRGLTMDEVQFTQPVQIEISSTGVCCRRARFPGGVQFRLRWARVVLDDTDLAAPSILSGIPHLADESLALQEKRIAKAWRRLLAGDITERPQLLSLRQADVAGLGLSNVIVADCRFAGAHNLDKLRLEPDVSFATAPSPAGPGGRKWSGREVIAEERAWRAHRSRRHWVAPGWPGWLDDQPGVLDPGQIAGLYRALRKGREDVKDEPGAADFYYGEMEMRRARPGGDSSPGGQSGAPSRGRAERGIVTAYWLVSGYGLRAWRAAAGLTVITALLAVAFHLVGFAVPPRPVSYWTSLLYAFRATLSLTDNEVKLTAWGQVLQGVLRLTGPVLLGLALLALRGRVKR
jgi:Pentapeptide repeats (9 copies)